MLKKINLKTIITAAAVLLLAVLCIMIFVRLNRMSARYDRVVELMMSESSVNRDNDDYLNNISSQLAYDLNTTRASLGLETSDYPFRDLTKEQPESGSSDKNILISAVGALIEAEEDNRKSAFLGRILRDDLISETLSGLGAVSRKIDNLNFSLEIRDESFMTMSAEGDSSIVLRNLSGSELDITSASREAADFIKGSLEEYIAAAEKRNDMTSKLRDLAADPQRFDYIDDRVRIVFENGVIEVSNTVNSNTISTGVLMNGLEPVYSLSGTAETYPDFDNLKSAYVKSVKQLDLRKNEEVILDNARLELETMLAEQSFIDYIGSMDLKLAPEPREDIDYFYYDLLHSDGSRLGSLSILKKLGDIYLVDADEVPVSSLKTLELQETMGSRSNSLIIPENIPEFDSLFSSKDSVTFLLVGNHEKNTDTMILVHADKISGKAYMIGIPRDLYWKGRKINSIYLNYGAEQFKKELSDITGLDITHYIVVDMYAFIDIVNILGGIEVTLEEDLVDPTYRIRENGEWSTLNYPKGSYNLNGVEALRVARSRHGSNDFDRSKRQQMIIEAFLNRIQNFGISDVNKVYEMMQALFEYIDTDFTLVEMMSLYNNYSDVELAGKHVLSFDNILYDTYSNVYMLDDKDKDFGPDFNKGAWILFPRENDWNNIRWYVRSIINGEI